VVEPDVLRANVKPEAELVPALLAAVTFPTDTWDEPVFVIMALSAQSDVSVCVAEPEVLVDETSGFAVATLSVQTPPEVKPQVPLLFIATDKFRAVSSALVVDQVPVGTRT
jgi:hypothetical protein